MTLNLIKYILNRKHVLVSTLCASFQQMLLVIIRACKVVINIDNCKEVDYLLFNSVSDYCCIMERGKLISTTRREM